MDMWSLKLHFEILKLMHGLFNIDDIVGADKSLKKIEIKIVRSF